jgi:hypothetical protein
MTEAELANHKERIKTLMINHLKLKVNFPNCTNQQVLNELKPMWILIEEANLKLEGMTFQKFVEHARNQAMVSEVSNFFNG